MAEQLLDIERRLTSIPHQPDIRGLVAAGQLQDKGVGGALTELFCGFPGPENIRSRARDVRRTEEIALGELVLEIPRAFQRGKYGYARTRLERIQEALGIGANMGRGWTAPHECIAAGYTRHGVLGKHIDGNHIDVLRLRQLRPTRGKRLPFSIGVDHIVRLDRNPQAHRWLPCRADPQRGNAARPGVPCRHGCPSVRAHDGRAPGSDYPARPSDDDVKGATGKATKARPRQLRPQPRQEPRRPGFCGRARGSGARRYRLPAGTGRNTPVRRKRPSRGARSTRKRTSCCCASCNQRFPGPYALTPLHANREALRYFEYDRAPEQDTAKPLTARERGAFARPDLYSSRRHARDQAHRKASV